MLEAAIMKYLFVKIGDEDDLEKCERYDRTIESFSPSDCKIFFEFKKGDLMRLFRLFNFPDVCRFDNKSVMPGEEVFLRGLYEIVTGENKHSIARNVFGRDWSAQSRAYKYFITHIYDNFKDLVMDNLHWWYRNGFFASSAEAIGRKMGLCPDDKNMIAHFIDCNCLETCRVGGGPAEDGCNSARWDPLVQRAFYRMAELQEGNEDQYMTFGDSAYKRRSHITSYYAEVEEGLARWNRRMKRVRISIEWNYGTTAAMFKYVCNKRKLKVLQSNTVSKVYTVATILRNLHIGLYGCQTSNYFDLDIPNNFIEKYLLQEDF